MHSVLIGVYQWLDWLATACFYSAVLNLRDSAIMREIPYIKQLLYQRGVDSISTFVILNSKPIP